MSLPLYLNPAAVTGIPGTTLLASWLAGGAISRTGPTGPFTDTTDSAANIVTALAGMQSASFPCQYINASGQTATIAAGAGVTLSGKTPSVAANTMALLVIYVDPSGAVDIKVLYRQSIT